MTSERNWPSWRVEVTGADSGPVRGRPGWRSGADVAGPTPPEAAVDESAGSTPRWFRRRRSAPGRPTNSPPISSFRRPCLAVRTGSRYTGDRPRLTAIPPCDPRPPVSTPARAEHVRTLVPSVDVDDLVDGPPTDGSVTAPGPSDHHVAGQHPVVGDARPRPAAGFAAVGGPTGRAGTETLPGRPAGSSAWPGRSSRRAAARRRVVAVLVNRTDVSSPARSWSS